MKRSREETNSSEISFCQIAQRVGELEKWKDSIVGSLSATNLMNAATRMTEEKCLWHRRATESDQMLSAAVCRLKSELVKVCCTGSTEEPVAVDSDSSSPTPDAA